MLMKSTLRALALSLSTLALPLSVAFASENVVVKVSGMTCGNCSQKITKALNALEGIEPGSVEVDLAGKTAKVKAIKADEKTMALIKSTIEKLEYTVESVQAEPAKETKAKKKS